MGIGRGAGKLLLFGEHAAVYGYPAMGVALPLEITVETAPAIGWERPPLPAREGRLIDAAIMALPEAVGHHVEPQRLTITSTLPMSRGFGSSAAFSVALLHAIAARALRKAGPEKHAQALWSLANRLETVFHGTPSGIDTGLSVLGGAQAFRPAPPHLPRATAVSLPVCHLVVGWLPRTLGTAELVGGIRERIAEGDRSTQTAMDRLGALSADVVTDIEHRGPALPVGKLGGYARGAQELLRGLGISTPELDDALEILERNGAAGAKLSGGGGGGAFFGVFADGGDAARAAAALETERRCPVMVFSYSERTNLSLEPRFP